MCGHLIIFSPARPARALFTLSWVCPMSAWTLTSSLPRAPGSGRNKPLCSGHKICPVSLMTPLSGFLTTGRKALQNPWSPEPSPPIHVPLFLYLQAPAPNSELTTFLWGDESLPHKDLPPSMAYSPCFWAGKSGFAGFSDTDFKDLLLKLKTWLLNFCLLSPLSYLEAKVACGWKGGKQKRKKWLLYDFTWLCSYS